MKDSSKNTKVNDIMTEVDEALWKKTCESRKTHDYNDLISLVESNEWIKCGSDYHHQVVMVEDLYTRLKAAKRFVPPDEGEVEIFMTMELQHWPSSPSAKVYAETEAHKFVAFYASKGWMVGKNKMKDWQAAARGWLERNRPSKEAPIVRRSDPPKSDDYRLF